MSKILIGRGVTNSNGVATMTENANGEPINGYTATGAGKVDFSAGCTIDNRTFLSETYATIDAIFYDKGILNDPQTRNWNGTWSSTVNRGSEYTTLTHDNSTNVGSYYKLLTPSDMCIEMDLRVNQQITALITLRQGSSTKSGYQQNDICPIGEWVHIKLIIQENTLTAIVDGVEKTPQSITGEYDRFLIHNGSVADNTIDFKNFVVYPI